MEGVPWDFNRVRVAEATLREQKPDLPSLSMGTVVDIFNAGNQVAYTTEARNMFAQEAIIAINQLQPGEDPLTKLTEVVEKVNQQFPKS